MKIIGIVTSVLFLLSSNFSFADCSAYGLEDDSRFSYPNYAKKINFDELTDSQLDSLNTYLITRLNELSTTYQFTVSNDWHLLEKNRPVKVIDKLEDFDHALISVLHLVINNKDRAKQLRAGRYSLMNRVVSEFITESCPQDYTKTTP